MAKDTGFPAASKQLANLVTLVSFVANRLCVPRGKRGACILNYRCSRSDHVVRRTSGAAPFDEARDSDHGSAVDARRVLGARNPGSLPGTVPPRLYHRADHGVPARDQEGGPAPQEDRQCAHFRGARLAECGAAPADRRAARLLWRPLPARRRPPDRGRQAHARRRTGSRATAEEAAEEGEAAMTPLLTGD